MPPDYHLFSEADFILDEYFQQWVRKPDASSNAFWQAWLREHPEKAAAVVGAKSFVENLAVQQHYPRPEDTEDALRKSLDTITSLESDAVRLPTVAAQRHIYRFLAAAVFMGLVVIAGFMAVRNQSPVTVLVQAAPGEIKPVQLPDSSLVTLNGGSELRYTTAVSSSSQREVWLKGEAFFDVRHLEKAGAAARFVVHTGDMDIEVLGTTFNVKENGGNTNVSLNTGKIKIGLKAAPATPIFLFPGDLVKYSTAERKVTRKKVKPELYSVWKGDKLVVDRMSLAEITGLLEDAYGYTIVIENKALARSSVSGTLLLNDERILLQTLAFVLHIDIEKNGNTLHFRSKK